jgi:hypothetical protein
VIARTSRISRCARCWRQRRAGGGSSSQSTAKTAAAETEASPGQAEITCHKAPSFLWFVIPLGLLLVYGYLSR